MYRNTDPKGTENCAPSRNAATRLRALLEGMTRSKRPPSRADVAAAFVLARTAEQEIDAADALLLHLGHKP